MAAVRKKKRGLRFFLKKKRNERKNNAVDVSKASREEANRKKNDRQVLDVDGQKQKKKNSKKSILSTAPCWLVFKPKHLPLCANTDISHRRLHSAAPLRSQELPRVEQRASSIRQTSAPQRRNRSHRHSVPSSFFRFKLLGSGTEFSLQKLWPIKVRL